MATQQIEQYIPHDAWIVDTGASHHITADATTLNQVTPFQGFDKITVGNGTGLSIKNIDATTIKTNTHDLILNNVLRVPKIARSLLYVQQLCANISIGFIILVRGS
ncbi:hypothetical protein EV1_042284 [Malus domestica]